MALQVRILVVFLIYWDKLPNSWMFLQVNNQYLDLPWSGVCLKCRRTFYYPSQISNCYAKIQSCLLLLSLVNFSIEFIAFVVHSPCWYPWVVFSFSLWILRVFWRGWFVWVFWANDEVLLTLMSFNSFQSFQPERFWGSRGENLFRFWFCSHFMVVLSCVL